MGPEPNSRSAARRLVQALGAGLVVALAAGAHQAQASEGGASLYLLGTGGPGNAVMPPLQGVFFDNQVYYYKGSGSGDKQFVGRRQCGGGPGRQDPGRLRHGPVGADHQSGRRDRGARRRPAVRRARCHRRRRAHRPARQSDRGLGQRLGVRGRRSDRHRHAGLEEGRRALPGRDHAQRPDRRLSQGRAGQPGLPPLGVRLLVRGQLARPQERLGRQRQGRPDPERREPLHRLQDRDRDAPGGGDREDLLASVVGRPAGLLLQAGQRRQRPGRQAGAVPGRGHGRGRHGGLHLQDRPHARHPAGPGVHRVQRQQPHGGRLVLAGPERAAEPEDAAAPPT
jgi:hypothetical protein